MLLSGTNLNASCILPRLLGPPLLCLACSGDGAPGTPADAAAVDGGTGGSGDGAASDVGSDACPKDCRGAGCAASGLCNVVVVLEPAKLAEGASALAAGAGLVAWSNYLGILHRTTLQTGEVEVVSDEGQSVTGILYSEGSFFWPRAFLGDVRSMAALGAPVTLALVAGRPEALTTTDGDPELHVSEMNGEALFRLPRSGGTAESLVADQEDIRYVASDDTWVVWTRPPLVGPGGSVHKLERSTGAVSTIAPDLPGPATIAVIKGYAYWANRHAVAGSLMRVALGGGSVEAVASMADVRAVTADAQRVYWGTASEIWSVQVPDGSPELLATDQQEPISISVDDAWIYWLSTATGQILRVAK